MTRAEWNRWNVALWLNNDEPLYRAMVSFYRAAGKNKDRAARAMYHALTDDLAGPITHTPDGARYTISAIRYAMIGLETD